MAAHTNSCPRGSFARKNESLRWWNAPRNAKKSEAGKRRSRAIASRTAKRYGRSVLLSAWSSDMSELFDWLLSCGMMSRRNAASA